MAYQQPETQYSQGQNVQNQEWQAGFCNCSPCESCLLGTFLPCMLYGQTSDRMNDPTMQTADNFNSDCMLFGFIQCFTGCGWILAMMKRGEIRERFGIKGSGMSDCCATYWCPCCALIQQDNEVKARLARGPVTQGYQAQKEGMQVPAPTQQQSPPPQQAVGYQSPPPQQGVGYQSPPPKDGMGYQSPPPPQMAAGYQSPPPPQAAGYQSPPHQGSFPAPQQQQQQQQQQYNPQQPQQY